MMGFSHVTVMRDRHGKLRYRYRRKGCKTVYLPGKPGSPEFAAAYALATNGVSAKIQPGASRTLPGTINDLAVKVYASGAWALKKPTTQTTYRGIIERIRTDYGTHTVNSIDTGIVKLMIDRRAKTPAAAGNLLKVLKFMMDVAILHGMRSDNPCIGVVPPKYESDGFKTWSEAEVKQFEDFWKVGTRERKAFDLLLHTVQRSGDVRQMGKQTAKSGRLEFRQQKTGAELSLPVVPSLQASLDTASEGEMLYIVTQFGVGYTAKGFGNWFSKAARKAGLVKCTAHGLRKTGATRLAEAGCSESEIMAWTGHQTPKEVQRYTKARNQKSLADRAAARTETEQTMANPETRLAK